MHPIFRRECDLPGLERANPPFLRLLVELVKLAGLCHDLGKANAQFQQMLRGTSGAQRIRHDLLGFLMFATAWRESLKTRKPEDPSWLNAALTPESFFAPLTVTPGILSINEELLKCLSRAGAGTEVDDFTLGQMFSVKARDTQPLGFAVAWLILTHHRLIGSILQDKKSNIQPQLGAPTTERFVNRTMPFQSANLEIPAGKLPWNQKSWSDAFTRAVSSVLSILAEHAAILQGFKAEKGASLFATMAYVLRPALIVGDQLASVMQADVLRRNSEKSSFEENELYANSVNRTAIAGDLLSTHLLSTAQRASFALNTLLNPSSHTFSRFETALLPQDSLLFSRAPVGSRFAWQQDAADVLAKVPGVSARPFFCALLSAPGSGKTGAGPRLLNIASGGSLRFTLALGLKSLTLQSGRAYAQKLRIPPASLATLVGDKAATMLFDAKSGPATVTDRLAAQVGSESLEAAEEQFEISGADERLGGTWLSSLQPAHNVTSSSGIFSDKMQRLIDAPVVACTVDHIAYATELTRNEDAKVALRIASSDLILDELDNYQHKDLVGLGKLVFMHGLYGRRVVLMSGTMSDYLVSRMYDVWLSGIRIHQRLTGSAAKPLAMLVSNLTPPALLDEPSSAAMRSAASGFCQTFAQKLLLTDAKAWPAFREMSTDVSPEPQLVEMVKELHSSQAIVDPVTGKPFSAGFVRFNSVGGAQRLARHLLNRRTSPGEPVIRVLCYHASYPRIHRALIEEFLDTAMNRAEDAVPSNPEVRQALAQAGAAGVTLVVCTTSIEETGRDHDFDWQILEPSSARSAAQAAGRLLRHRNKKPTSPNMLIMGTTLRALGGQNLPYGRAGVQDNHKFSATDEWLMLHPGAGGTLHKALVAVGIASKASDTAVSTVSARELLPSQSWSPWLTPADCLVTPSQFEDSRLASLEFIEQTDYLGMGGASGAGTSLQAYLDSGCAAKTEMLWLDERHARAFGFRKSREDDKLGVCLNADLLSFSASGESFVGPSLHVPFEEPRVVYPERDILRLDSTLEQRFTALKSAAGWGPSILKVMGPG